MYIVYILYYIIIIIYMYNLYIYIYIYNYNYILTHKIIKIQINLPLVFLQICLEVSIFKTAANTLLDYR